MKMTATGQVYHHKYQSNIPNIGQANFDKQAAEINELLLIASSPTTSKEDRARLVKDAYKYAIRLANGHDLEVVINVREDSLTSE